MSVDTVLSWLRGHTISAGFPYSTYARLKYMVWRTEGRNEDPHVGNKRRVWNPEGVPRTFTMIGCSLKEKFPGAQGGLSDMVRIVQRERKKSGLFVEYPHERVGFGSMPLGRCQWSLCIRWQEDAWMWGN
jgi:hypothetical protein